VQTTLWAEISIWYPLMSTIAKRPRGAKALLTIEIKSRGMLKTTCRGYFHNGVLAIVHVFSRKVLYIFLKRLHNNKYHPTASINSSFNVFIF